MKLKKALGVTLSATMVLSTAVCGTGMAAEAETGNVPTEWEMPDEIAGGNAVTLKTVSMFAGTDPNAEVYQAISKEFTDKYPNVTLEDDSQPAGEEWKQKVVADFAVGNEPDVLQFFTYAVADTVVDTGKLMTIEDIRAEYPNYAIDTKPDVLDGAKNYDGVERAVPTTGFWEGLFCNKDLFDQYGVALPTDWESFKTAVEVFNENDIIPVAVSLNEVPHYWIEYLMLSASGVEEYTSIPETAPQGWVDGLNTLQTLREMGAFPEDTDTVSNDYVGELFKTKKAAMQLEGNWYIGGITDTDNTVVVPFPGVENAKAEKTDMIGGVSSGFYITKKAWEDPDKREAAVNFVMAQTSNPGIQRYWLKGGAVAVAATNVVAPEELTPLSQSAIDYVNTAETIVLPSEGRLSGEAQPILMSGAVGISTGSTAAEDIINEALTAHHERKE